jgi:hypothetical protein
MDLAASRADNSGLAELAILCKAQHYYDFSYYHISNLLAN